jgi:hypothetical protein
MTFSFDSGFGAVVDDRFLPQFKDGHCFIALTPPVEGFAVFINFSSVKDYTSEGFKEVILEPGDHPYVSKRTCIPMTYARVWPVAHLSKWVNDNLPDVVTFERMDPLLHAKLIEAVIESDFARESVKEFIVVNFGDRSFKRAKSCVTQPDSKGDSGTP